MNAQVLLIDDYRPVILPVSLPETPAIQIARALANARDALQQPEGFTAEEIEIAANFLMEYGGADDQVLGEAALLLIARDRRADAEGRATTSLRTEVAPWLCFCAASYLFLLFFMGVTP